MTVSNYNQDSRGYGELNSHQKLVVDDNVFKIKNAREGIDSSLLEVSAVKNEFTLLQAGVAEIGSSYFLSDATDDKIRTDTEKKIWSNMSSNVKGLESEKMEIEKALRVLEKFADNYERNISSEIVNLQKLSEKVESLKADPGWGWLNWIFSQTKTTRVRESSVNAEVALVKASEADLQVKELTGRKEILNKEINDLFIEQIGLKNAYTGRVELAKNIGNEIAIAKAKYNSLLSKYEARQETFYKYKVPSKIKNEDKADILSGLNKLKAEISYLEVLEKRVVEEKIILGDYEGIFKKSIKENLQQTNASIASESQKTQGLISNTISEKMGVMDKMWSSISGVFSSYSEKKVENSSDMEITILNKLYNESIIGDEKDIEVDDVFDRDEIIEKK